MGEVHAVVRGDLRAFVQSGNIERLEEGNITPQVLDRLTDPKTAGDASGEVQS